jgi:AAA+ ATPase superfamily predicted ATPase
MTRIFRNREEELKTLEKCWSSKKFEFIIIFGRRRVGKTELIKEFVKNKKAIYFLCSDRKPLYNLEKFSEKVCNFIGIPVTSFKSFQDSFDAVTAKTKERVSIVIDEFGYLVRKNSGILSDFQEIVDEKLKDKNLVLILCGSSVSMMETRVLGYKSPLYGRATRYMKIKPFDFLTIKSWFPKTSTEDLIKIYSVTNGIAKYLEFFTGKNVEKEIVKNFFDPSAFLYGDATRLLSDELRDYSTYIQVLEAIGLGYNKVNEIADYAFVQPKDVFFYLKVLSSLGIVKRVLPIFSPRKAKRGIYVIDDNYFNFWFRFVSPFQAEIESNFLDVPIKNFEKQFNAYLGNIFERISHQIISHKRGFLPFTPMKIGRWWHKDKEIDIVVANDKTKEIGFFEVKWKDLSYDDCSKILNKLKEKANYVNWYNRSRKEYYGIIAKKIESKEELRKEFLAYELKDFENPS